MPQPIQIYNTLSRKKEAFEPIKEGEVGIYACGPTVYNYAHIGNLRTYIFEDNLRRTFARAGYKVTHVMNVTDVGHLQSDADEGEDKMSLAAKREAKSPWEIARFYEDAFFSDCKKLEILRPHKVCRATDHIPEMIDFIKTLEDKGAAYTSGGNVYFDTTKFPQYADFARLLTDADTVNRVDTDDNKRNSRDFVLWFSLEGSKFPNQIMKWDTPWGEGFPGWHIECSAMSSKYLGDHFDIHCGGIDHIPVHHTNEIAQSEMYHGHKWVNYWMHGEFLNVDEGKMSKSKGKFLTLDKIIEDGYLPIHYRYLCQTAHYRSPLRFSYEALDGARQAYTTLCHKADEWRSDSAPVTKPSAAAKQAMQKIDSAMRDDLNTAVALSALWEAVRAPGLSAQDKLAVLETADSALGMQGFNLYRSTLSPEQENTIALREEMRLQKNWQEADRLRQELAEQGIMLKDRPEGTTWYEKKRTPDVNMKSGQKNAPTP